MAIRVKKSDNRLYGSYFEQLLCDTINETNVAQCPLCVSDAESQEMMREAKDGCVALRKHCHFPVRTAKWVGTHTSVDSCDIILDGIHELEVKYVSTGKGTWYNTSIDKVGMAFGHVAYSDFLRSRGYYAWLASQLETAHTDIIPHLDSASPLTMREAKTIRHRYPETYAAICAHEHPHRLSYVRDFAKHLIDSEQVDRFFHAMLDKSLSGKHMPEMLLVCNHSKGTITVLTADDIKDSIKTPSADSLATSGVSIAFDGLRCTFAWQNGTGLNNATVRVFLT